MVLGSFQVRQGRPHPLLTLPHAASRQAGLGLGWVPVDLTAILLPPVCLHAQNICTSDTQDSVVTFGSQFLTLPPARRL